MRPRAVGLADRVGPYWYGASWPAIRRRGRRRALLRQLAGYAAVLFAVFLGLMFWGGIVYWLRSLW